ncbi:DUF1127 domain-containing protein [Pontibaca salina]|uniref:DUF1127 domain-containing protein n=1 Tax=Pontibaca salina TaxID=2795731 RepID=A0A934HQ02_9RHOB|nr:DUF1127 domain-containing protein [Pontibaca salina]MBI6628821.1 DUF1127 domain-containing protein [Pontibaca salina]
MTVHTQPQWQGQLHPQIFAPAMPGLFRRLRRVFARGFANWQRRRAIATLQSFDDHLLSDIGITRGQIPHYIREIETYEADQSLTSPRQR